MLSPPCCVTAPAITCRACRVVLVPLDVAVGGGVRGSPSNHAVPGGGGGTSGVPPKSWGTSSGILGICCGVGGDVMSAAPGSRWSRGVRGTGRRLGGFLGSLASRATRDLSCQGPPLWLARRLGGCLTDCQGTVCLAWNCEGWCCPTPEHQQHAAADPRRSRRQPTACETRSGDPPHRRGLVRRNKVMQQESPHFAYLACGKKNDREREDRNGWRKQQDPRAEFAAPSRLP